MIEKKTIWMLKASKRPKKWVKVLRIEDASVIRYRRVDGDVAMWLPEHVFLDLYEPFNEKEFMNAMRGYWRRDDRKTAKRKALLKSLKDRP